LRGALPTTDRNTGYRKKHRKLAGNEYRKKVLLLLLLRILIV